MGKMLAAVLVEPRRVQIPDIGPEDAVPVPILRRVLQENSLKGSVAGMGEDMHDTLTLLAQGRFRTGAFTGATYPRARIQEAFDTLSARPGDLKTQIAIG